MVLKLYSAPRATAGKGLVALVLAEKQIPFELVVVDMDDDGFILYESRAICRYLAEKYAGQGTPLLPAPTDLKAKARFEQAASIEFANFYPPVLKVVRETFLNRVSGRPTNAAVVAEGLDQISTKLDVYEVILGKQKFLGGNVRPIPTRCYHSLSVSLSLTSAQERPNVARWWKELISRPAWVKLQADGIRGTVI
ncbi:glutathione S-transferase [Mycena vulgaris]|nr:glutathione S-transferase [Mycena vulgaris]